MTAETEYELEDSIKDSGVSSLDSPNRKEFVANTKDICGMELVGGKAFNISKLAREGFAVPEGFCITTKAYDYFINLNDISKKDGKIRDRIRKASMPPLLARIIRNAAHRYLGGSPCAVRSSSPLEDLKSASFAGQYKSFLNVKGENALLNAIKECWASLWSQSAIEYRKKMGIGDENIKMAVLVQEMLPATASGVLFTEDQIVVEAVWGLGDILVGGKVIPDHHVVEREGLKVVKRRISHKEVMSRASSTGGVEIVDIPEQLQDVPALQDARLLELCALGKRVEKLFGCPQDIEWTLCNDAFVLLQARPVSVRQEPTVWSRANAAETQPGYVTYLSRMPENKPDDIVLGLRPLLERFGIKDVSETVKFREYIYGHVYLNMTTIHNTLGQIPGLSPEVLDKSLGHSNDEEVPESRLGLSAMMKLLPGTLRVIWFFMSLPKRAEQVIPHSVELIDNIKHKNLQEMNLKALDDLVWEMYERNSHVFQVHAVTALAAMSLFGILQKMTARIGEEGTENLLTIGLEGMSSSRLGLEMWKLARSASTSSRVSGLILSRRKDAIEELKRFSEGVAFLKRLDQFTEEYGDRCSQELELSVSRWGEDPYFILSMVANYLNNQDLDPVKTMERQKKIRLETTDRILKKLSKNPIEKMLFEKILEKTQQYIIIRENLKTTWVKGLSAMRILYLNIAEELVKKGILEIEDDIFYLKMKEVSDIVANSLKRGQFEDRIKDRKKEKAECELLDVPEVIVGSSPPIEKLKCTVEPKTQLEGTGCSHGVATGRARVVLDPGKCGEFRKGDILVAPVTDPGWTPLFVTAGGLVMELGGTLSHGVIIAREYGIPAVVGVKNVTKLIKTDQIVTVDGNKGVVYIRE